MAVAHGLGRAGDLERNSAAKTASSVSHSISRRVLALTQRVALVAQQGRQQIIQDPARSGLDLHRYRHPWRQVDHPAVDLHLGAVERNARAVIELLALRLAGVALRARRALVGAVLLPVADNGVLRYAEHPAVQQAVTGEVESIDLDVGVLFGLHEANGGGR